jgi:serine/threonine protein kinase
MDKENVPAVKPTPPSKDAITTSSTQKRKRVEVKRQPTFAPLLLSVLSATHTDDTTRVHVTSCVKQQLTLENVNRALNLLFVCFMSHKTCGTNRKPLIDIYEKVLNYFTILAENEQQQEIIKQLRLQKIALLIGESDQQTERESLKSAFSEAYYDKSLIRYSLFFALFALFESKCGKDDKAHKLLHHRTALASKPIEIIHEAQQLQAQKQLHLFNLAKYFPPIPVITNMPTATITTCVTSTGSSNSSGSGELEPTVVNMNRAPSPAVAGEDEIDMVELLSRIRKRKETSTDGRARKRMKPTSVSIQSPTKITPSTMLPPQPTPPPQHVISQSPHHHLIANPEIFVVNGIQYTKIDIIGRGGSSKVFRCFDPERKIVALKRVKLEGHDDSSLNGFINEVELLQRLRGKPNIIQLLNYEINSTTKTLSIVMECGEADLNTLLRNSRQKYSPNHIRLYWQQMLEAVHTIHEQRIVHGDLKPANFLLVRGTLKLIDFGIAKAIQNDTTNIVRDNQIGTPNYISPEALMVSGSGNRQYKLGRASDIWSLGCILYQMVYGKAPFADVQNLLSKIQAITDPKHVIRFDQNVINPDTNAPMPVDSAVIDVLTRTLVRDPQKRATIPALLQHVYLVPSMLILKSVETIISDLLKLNENVDGATGNVITRELLERLANNYDVKDVISQLVPKKK